MDKTDVKILSELQRNGRLSSQALAEKVGLSTTPCWRRVKRMELEGLIAGIVVLLAPARVGLNVMAFAQVYGHRRGSPRPMLEAHETRVP